MRCLKKISWFLGALLLLSPILKAQPEAGRESQDEAYLKVATQRAEKIVSTLGISDSSRFNQVRKLVAGQYAALNQLQTVHDAQVKDLKNTAASDKAATDARLKSMDEENSARLDELHKKYLASLGSLLTPEQVAQVKDGMTYGVLPITYKGYLAMLPGLTGVQKDQIMTWLTEAREHAMDAGSSEAKHGWFGKYKGRINNYLSAQGYNMKQASDEYARKIREEAAAKKQ